MDDLTYAAYFGLTKVFISATATFWLSSGTLYWGAAWRTMFVSGVSVLLMTNYFLKHDRALVERRLTVGPLAEKQPIQRFLVAMLYVIFSALSIIAGLDHRYGWSHIPLPLQLLGLAGVALSNYMIFVVFATNTFTSGTVTTHKNQKVIDHGPYAIVRHPMYGGLVPLLVGLPLALDSWYAYPFTLLAFVTLAVRAVYEERFLIDALEGYTRYTTKVPWRIVPFVF